MRVFLMIQILMLFSVTTIAQTGGIYLEREGLMKEQARKNNVKSLKVFSYNFEEKNQDSLGVLMNEQIYDKTGNIIQKNYSDQYDVGVGMYTYDSTGKLYEERIFDKKGRIQSFYSKEKVAFYDSTGKIDSYSTFKYDAKGNKLQQIMFNKKGIITEIISYKYDERGNQIEEIFGDEPSFPRKFIYDTQGNIIKEYSGSKLVATYVYDSNNHLLEEARGTSTQQYKVYYSYDTSGNLTKIYFSHANDAYCCNNQEYFYDSKGLLIKKIEVNALNNKKSIEYYVYSFFETNKIYLKEYHK